MEFVEGFPMASKLLRLKKLKHLSKNEACSSVFFLVKLAIYPIEGFNLKVFVNVGNIFVTLLLKQTADFSEYYNFIRIYNLSRCSEVLVLKF